MPCSQYSLNSYLRDSKITILPAVLNHLLDKPAAPPEAGILTLHGEGKRWASVSDGLVEKDTCSPATQSRFERQQNLLELKSCHDQEVLVLEINRY